MGTIDSRAIRMVVDDKKKTLGEAEENVGDTCTRVIPKERINAGESQVRGHSQRAPARKINQGPERSDHPAFAGKRGGGEGGGLPRGGENGPPSRQEFL